MKMINTIKKNVRLFVENYKDATDIMFRGMYFNDLAPKRKNNKK